MNANAATLVGHPAIAGRGWACSATGNEEQIRSADQFMEAVLKSDFSVCGVEQHF